MYTVNTVGIPRLGLLYRTQEHFIHTQGIGSVFLNNHIRVYYVVHGLTHLFNRPSANIFAVFQNKFGIVVFGTPVLEGFHVEHIIGNDVDIHMKRSHVILILQAQ